MDTPDYKKASNNLFSLIGTIVHSIRHFRFYGDEVSYIYFRLEDAQDKAEEMILDKDDVSFSQWKQVYETILNSMYASSEYAKKCLHIENVQALYKCLILIETSTEYLLNPPEECLDICLSLGVIINTILFSHLTDIQKQRSTEKHMLPYLLYFAGEELTD